MEQNAVWSHTTGMMKSRKNLDIAYESGLVGSHPEY